MSAKRSLPLALAFGLVLSVSLASIVTAAIVHVPQTATRDIVPAQARPNLNTQTQIVFLRGLANVFSRGMDGMAATLRADGFSPQVINHRGWQNAADTIAAAYRGGQTAPIVIVGHSLGANAAFRLAKRLNASGIPVAYLATFDPTRTYSVPGNVRYFANFYQNNGMGRPAKFPAARQKQKVNLNLTTSPGMTHTNIDQSPRLQRIVIGRIMEAAAR
jgi:pimeloyl-ACP methyl ester carboxylesterase